MTLMTARKFFEKSLENPRDVLHFFVTLQKQRRCFCECGLRLSKARASSALRSPCTTLVSNEDAQATTLLLPKWPVRMPNPPAPRSELQSKEAASPDPSEGEGSHEPLENHNLPIHLLRSPDKGAKVRTSHLTYVSTTYYLFSVHSVYSVASVPEGDY